MSRFYTQFLSYSSNIKRILVWNVLFCLGLGIYLVLYNIFLQNIVHDEVTIGKIIGINFLAQAFIYIPAGLFSDRVGSRKGVMLGVSLFIFALIGNLFAGSTIQLYFWGFLLGIGHAASIVTFVPLLTEYSNQMERKDLFTFAFSTGTFFTFIGTLLGGVLSDIILFSFNLSQITSIRVTLLIAIMMLLLCIIPLFFIKQAKVSHIDKWPQRSIYSIFKNNRSILLPIMRFSMSKGIAGVSIGIILPFINLFYMNKFSLSPTKISIILAVGTLATVIFMAYNTNITNKISEVYTVSLYHLLSVPAVILLGVTQNIWVSIIAFILFRATKFGLNPIESKIMMDTVDPDVRGLANSFGFMANSICISIVGPFAMYIVQIKGYDQGYFILCILSSLTSLIVAAYFLLAFGKSSDHKSKLYNSTPA